MRKEAIDDFDDNLPSLTANDRDEDEPVLEPRPGARHEAVYSRTVPVIKVKAPGSGALWALVAALFIALGGLGWWSFQQISLMEQQLVATQESFAKVSEEAAGRLQAISGKVADGENSVTSDTEALKLQVRQLQARLDDQGRQQQGVAGQQGATDKRVEQLNGQLGTQAAAAEQVQNQLKALSTDLASLKAAQAGTTGLEAELKSLATDVTALKKQSDVGSRLERLEQELVVLKSEQDNRPAAAQASGPSTAEFDAFRGQTTRNVNGLQAQIQNLQEQIDRKAP
ncbi:ATPase [Pseudomonas sp. RIT-PI-S]|uniref:ATPase n=1 Tax=Pseudomonas sp. RIT-PI-S TaxID=3035295 RepID=UPI0021D86316|nr:ATPase [Pseudomonas sp. RIT-PI-S]